MRALIRRIVDRILGCRPKQVARRRDLYGWSGMPQPPMTREEIERAEEVQRRLKRIYGSYAEPPDWFEFTAEQLEIKHDNEDNDKEN